MRKTNIYLVNQEIVVSYLSYLETLKCIHGCLLRDKVVFFVGPVSIRKIRTGILHKYKSSSETYARLLDSIFVFSEFNTGLDLKRQTCCWDGRTCIQRYEMVFLDDLL